MSLRLASNKVPEYEDLSIESEVTKKLYLQWEYLEVHDGLVYRKFLSQRGEEPDYLQLLVPRSDVGEVLRQCHAGVVGGHFGIRRTQDQVKRRYYWPSWKQDTRRFCQRCLECNTYHRGRPKKQGPLKPVLAGAPFERWYIDLTGPHPRSAKGNIWILTCMDGFTKWAEAYPLRNKEAETIAKALVEQLFCRFGPLLSILSDQGKEVDGRIMNEVFRLFGVAKLRKTPYKPSTNQVERFHRTMNAILAKTIDEHQRDWDSQLPFTMAAYRASRHEGTDYSPNFLVLGREVHAPMDLMYGTPDEGHESYNAFVEERRERMVSAFTEVRNTLRRSAERNKRYYDLSVKPKTFETGQWVWYFNLRKYRGKQMKWTRQYEGPFLIIRVVSPLTVEIQRSAKSRPKTVHVDKLKEFLGTPSRSWLDTRTASDKGNSPSSTPLATVGTSPESEVSPAEAAEGTSAGAADDSSAEGMFPKAFDEVLESEFITATGMPAAEELVMAKTAGMPAAAQERLVSKSTRMPVPEDQVSKAAEDLAKGQISEASVLSQQNPKLRRRQSRRTVTLPKKFDEFLLGRLKRIGIIRACRSTQRNEAPKQSNVPPLRISTNRRMDQAIGLASSAEIEPVQQQTDELTAKYDLRPTETRAKVNEVRVARQARRAFATEIRRHLRQDADEEGRRQFLTWLEEECARAEGEESDEMT